MKNSYLLIFVLLLFSCGMDGNGLKKYVEDESNGLVQTVAFKDVEYKMTYRPNDLAYVYEMRGEPLDKSSHEKFIADNGHTSLFILDINFFESTRKEVVDFNPIKVTYQNTLNAQYFSLIDESGITPCIIYHCETVSKGSYKISVLFEKDVAKISSDWKVSFTDIVTGENPEFVFKKNDISNIPTLKI